MACIDSVLSYLANEIATFCAVSLSFFGGPLLVAFRVIVRSLPDFDASSILRMHQCILSERLLERWSKIFKIWDLRICLGLGLFSIILARKSSENLNLKGDTLVGYSGR